MLNHGQEGILNGKRANRGYNPKYDDDKENIRVSTDVVRRPIHTEIDDTD